MSTQENKIRSEIVQNDGIPTPSESTTILQIKFDNTDFLNANLLFQAGKIKAAYTHAKKAADNGTAIAHFFIAEQLIENHHIELHINNKEAAMREHLELAAKNGCFQANYRIGMNYLCGGLPYPEDPKKGFEELKIAADQGHLDAKNLLASSCYAIGLGTNQDKKLAFDLAKELVLAKRYLYAYATLGLFYKIGLNGERDINKAKACFRLGSMAGNEECQILYIIQKIEEDILKDTKETLEAEQAFQKIKANPKPTHGHTLLGNLYRLGKFVPKDEALAFRLFKIASKNKIYAWGLEANFQLGLCYLQGKGVTKDPKLAFEHLLISANRGNIEAKFYLAQCYLSGVGTVKNLDEALKLFNELDIYYSPASEGLSVNPIRTIIFYHLGMTYQEKGDIANAIEQFLLAANREHVPAKLELARCYLNDVVTSTNTIEDIEDGYRLALEILENELLFCDNKKIKKEAYYLLGRLYLEGKGVTANKGKAIEYFKEAFNLQHEKAARALADCFKEDQDSKSQAEYLTWLEKAANDKLAPDREAAILLGGYLLDKTSPGFNPTNAVALFNRVKKASSGKNKHALNAIAVCELMGWGEPANQTRAIQQFAKQADKSPYAANNHGWCLLNGLGTQKDPKKAVEHFNAAINEGSSQAIKNLAWCYLNGLCVTMDLDHAIKLFEEAKEQERNNPKTTTHCKTLGLHYGLNWSHDADLETLLQDNPFSLNRLGECYLHGWGVTQDFDKALALFQKSTELLKKGEALYLSGWQSECLYDDPSLNADSVHIMTARDYYKQAAALGHPEALLSLGWLYDKGKLRAGSDPDLKSDSENSCNQTTNLENKSKAECKGGSEGEKIKQLQIAFHYYKKSAELGNVEAMFNLGTLFEEGVVVPKKMQTAIEWYSKAKATHTPSLNRLANIRKFGLDRERTEKFTKTP